MGVEALYAFAGLEAVQDIGMIIETCFAWAVEGSPNTRSWRPHELYVQESRPSLAKTICKLREFDECRTQILAQVWDASMIGARGVLQMVAIVVPSATVPIEEVESIGQCAIP